MNTLDDYESGYLYVYPQKHWWRFWKPKPEYCGSWVRIGNIVNCTVLSNATQTNREIIRMFPEREVHILRYSA